MIDIFPYTQTYTQGSLDETTVLSGHGISVRGHFVPESPANPIYDPTYNSLDIYYRRFIGDVLKTIRHGFVDYVFKPSHLEELRRFEPRLKVKRIGGAYEVRL